LEEFSVWVGKGCNFVFFNISKQYFGLPNYRAELCQAGN